MMRRAAVLIPALLLAAPALAQSVSVGAATVKLQGRIDVDPGITSGRAQAGGVSEALRLYPSVVVEGGDGLRFGLAGDLREADQSQPGGIRDGQIYSRRAYGFVSSASLGTLRFGTTDGAGAINQVGTFDVGPAMFNDGGWNGVAHFGVAAGLNPAFPFASSRYYGATNKIVYLSPRWENLNLNVSFEPNVHGALLNQGGHYAADANSDFTTAANSGTDAARRRNTLDAD